MFNNFRISATILLFCLASLFFQLKAQFMNYMGAPGQPMITFVGNMNVVRTAMVKEDGFNPLLSTDELNELTERFPDLKKLKIVTKITREFLSSTDKERLLADVAEWDSGNPIFNIPGHWRSSHEYLCGVRDYLNDRNSGWYRDVPSEFTDDWYVIFKIYR